MAMALCELCKVNEATIQLTRMVGDEVRKISLCEACATENGISMENSFSIAEMLLGLGAGAQEKSARLGKTCPFCQMRFTDFKKTSRLGCPVCYETFAEELDSLLDAMHKGKKHVGKTPVSLAPAGSAGEPPATLVALKQMLEQAVAVEDYEEAVRLRDQIRLRMQKGSQPTAPGREA